MNRKGFTLIELIIVITLIAMVSLLATPNVIQMVENGNKDKMIADANNFLDDVMYKYSLEKYKDFYPTENGKCNEIKANENIFAIDLDKDYAGNEYDKVESRVKVCLEDNTYKYYIKLVSTKDGNCVNMLSSKDDEADYVAFEDLNRSNVKKCKNKDYSDPIIPEEEKTKIAYAVYSDADNSLTFYKTIDTITEGENYRGKIATDVYIGFENNDYGATSVPWYEHKDDIKSIFIADEGISPKSTSYWFHGIDNENFTSIDLSKLNTENLIDMSYMFNGSDYLQTVIFGSNWNTSKVTTMYGLFWNCYSLVSVDVSGWNTENVTKMQYMFYSCKKLTLDCSHWDVNDHVTYTGFNDNAPGVIAPNW